jgi:dihydrofolate synthase/folylpolyglutamate synthase
MNALLDKLSRPESHFKIIHIAGTNGKGSTGTFIASVLKEAGYKTGHYSSPAVFEEREIIKVNGRNISEKDYVNLIEEIKNTGLSFTRFELETALALLYFCKKGCDYAVIECGLGGREDATNAMADTHLSVFCQIGMDHMQYLGDCVEKIALNKAGIIRENGHVVYIKSNTESDNAIETTALNKHATVSFCNTKDISNIVYSKDKTEFDYKETKGVKLSLLGEFQPSNASLAIEACKALSDMGAKISEKHIKEGLFKATLPGRFEKVSDKPLMVIDGAHNEPASKVLAKNITRYFENRRLIFIIGVLKDKEYDKVIRNTCDLAWQVITVTSPNRQRALPAMELAEAVREVNPNVTAADSIPEAVETALLMAAKDDVIVAFGSLSYLSKIKEFIKEGKINV